MLKDVVRSALAAVEADMTTVPDRGGGDELPPTMVKMKLDKLHDGYRRTGLLLRSPKPLAARLERKHERAAAAIPAEEVSEVRF